MSSNRIDYYTVDELMATCMARTIKEGNTVYNAVAVPLPFTAIMLASKTHAPNSIFWGGLLAGVNPRPPVLPQTSGDSVMLYHANPVLHAHHIYDLAMQGELDRIFFSGAQIDKYGNLNNSLVGSPDKIRIKLPGGAGASHLGCFARNYTIWSIRHEAKLSGKGKKIFTFVDKVDFVTTVGHKTPDGTREELGLGGGGPDLVVTNLGTFDFEPETHLMRLKTMHPGLTREETMESTGFEPVLSDSIAETPRPTREEVEIIRKIDPMETRKLGFSPKTLSKRFDF
jgi:glutaconate CoA-transferase subunit B